MRRLSNPPLCERAEDVWQYIDRKGPDECWPWTRGKTESGYGAVSLDLGSGRRQYGAHVLVAYLRGGSLPGRGLVVRHVCDNPICCNPAHLVVGTQAENVRDMVVRGRMHRNHARGEALPFARLTEEQVREIRASYVPHKVGHRRLAKRFGVGKTTIEWVLKGGTWRHV